MRGLTGDELLRLPVQVRGIPFGRAVDLLLHPNDARALGVDVLCKDERHRFLPLSVASVGDEAVEAASPLVLLDLNQDSFYRLEATALSDLRGAALDAGSVLRDVVLGRDWQIEELVVEDERGRRRVPLDGLLLPLSRRRRRRRG